MCTTAPKAARPVTTADQYDQFYVGDNFDAVDFIADDSVDASQFTIQHADKYVPHQGKVRSHWTQTTSENLPVGHFGNRQYTTASLPPELSGKTTFNNQKLLANPEARSPVSKQEDGSYLGNITSRTREDGTTEFGRYKFSSRPQGQYSMINGELGVAEQNNMQRVRRKSDTRGIAPRTKQSGATTSIRSNGSAKKKGTSSFAVVPDTGNPSGATSAGFNVPTG